MPEFKLAFPWGGEAFIRGNLAIGNLQRALQQRMTINGRVHAETLLTAAGALVGYAGQNAFWKVTGLTPDSVPAIGTVQARIGVARTFSGERYYFGDGLNAYLSGDARDAPQWAFWPYVRGALVQLGVPAEGHADERPMYAYVSSKVGKPDFGMPSLAGHAPGASAPQFVRGLWPLFHEIMALPLPAAMDHGDPEIGEEHWPVVAMVTAGTFLTIMKDVIDARIAAQVMMEAAIAGSKVDPATVPIR